MPVYSDVPFPQALDSAERAIETALSLDPNHAAAHATLGSMRADDWRWAESEPHFVRALQLNDGDATTHQWYGEMLLRTGRLPEAIEQLKAAEQRDPLTSVIPTNLGWMYLESGRYDEALSAFRSAIEFDPRHVQAHVGIGYALLDRGRFDEAIQALEKAAVLANGQRLTRAHLARGYALAGRKPDAEKVYDELKLEASRKNGSAWGAALVALALGRKDEALDWLERGYERREIAMGYLKTSQSFKPLRSDHRFIGLLKKMGL
jgi:serine/threonine-protein kinase